MREPIRVALVSLWATWCEACEREMDALNRLEAKLDGFAQRVVAQNPQHIAHQLAEIDGDQRRIMRRHPVQKLDQGFLVIGQRSPSEGGCLLREGRILPGRRRRARKQFNCALQSLQLAPRIVQVRLPAPLAHHGICSRFENIA